MNSIKKDKMVVFDFDETLVKSSHVWEDINDFVMNKLSLPHNDYIVKNIFSLFNTQYIGWGKDLEEQKKIYVHEFEPLVSLLTAKPDFYKKMYFFDKMKDVIKILSSFSFSLAIASSRDLLSIIRFLEHEGMLKYFDSVQATQGGLVFDDKPNTSVVNYVSAGTGVPLSNSVMIGDSPSDVIMGKNAGMKTVGIGYGAFTSAVKIAKYSPDVVIESEKNIKKLPDTILKLLNQNSR